MADRFTEQNRLVVVLHKKQVLSAEIMEEIEQKYTPRYRFVQQPMFPISYDDEFKKTPPELRITIYKAKDEATNCPELAQLVRNDMELASTDDLTRGRLYTFHNVAKLLTVTERKQNWFIRHLPRSSSKRTDKLYVHLKTDIQLRSMVEVNDFIVFAKVRQRKKGDVDKTQAGGSGNRRGNTLINTIAIGHYNMETSEIVLFQIPQVEVQGSRKRKRGAKNEEGDKISHPIYALYNFEPIK